MNFFLNATSFLYLGEILLRYRHGRSYTTPVTPAYRLISIVADSGTNIQEVNLPLLAQNLFSFCTRLGSEVVEGCLAREK